MYNVQFQDNAKFNFVCVVVFQVYNTDGICFWDNILGPFLSSKLGRVIMEYSLENCIADLVDDCFL